MQLDHSAWDPSRHMLDMREVDDARRMFGISVTPAVIAWSCAADAAREVIATMIAEVKHGS